MKQSLRQKIIKLRENQPLSQKTKKEIKIHQNLTKLNQFSSAHTILLYSSFRGEVSLREIKKQCIKNKTLVLPKVDKRKNELKLYEIPDLTYLQKGFAGIMEAPEHLKEISPKKIDLTIIPGVAFDKKGNRIGFGQGFYDKLIPNLNCPKIAVAFEFQLVDKIPTETHDKPIDIIITEERTIITQKNHSSH